MWNYIDDDKNTLSKIKQIEHDNNYKVTNCYIDIKSLDFHFNEIIYGDNDIILGNLKKIENEKKCIINITYYNLQISIPYENYFIYKKYELFSNENFIELSEIKYNKKILLKIKIYIKK